MSCLCWNVWGLGSHRTVRELAKIVRAQDPTVMFFAETWLDDVRLEKICDDLNFDEKWVVDRVTRARGLALLWKNTMNIKVVDSSLNYIDVIIDDGHVDSWRFTKIYGFPKATRKRETWELLRELGGKFYLPWICAGGFNKILRSHEKLGGLPRGEAKMGAFKDIVDECDFSDLGYMGNKYTWRGKRGENMILERLDRAFATVTWLDMFPATRVQHLHSHASDHYPIIIKLDGIAPCRNKPFRFKSMWMKEAGCKEIVVDAWGFPVYDSSLELATSKIKCCGEKLVEWSRSSFGSIQKQLKEKSKLLEQAKLAVALGSSYENVRALKKEVNDLMAKEFLMWQRSFQRSF